MGARARPSRRSPHPSTGACGGLNAKVRAILRALDRGIEAVGVGGGGLAARAAARARGRGVLFVSRHNLELVGVGLARNPSAVPQIGLS